MNHFISILFVISLCTFMSFQNKASSAEAKFSCTTSNYEDWQQAIKNADFVSLQDLANSTNCLNIRSRPSLLRYAALNSTYDIYVSLVDLGADILAWHYQENSDECFYQALHAIQYLRPVDSFKFVKFLVERGADVRSRPYDGLTGKPSSSCQYSFLPLANSVWTGDVQTFRFLADHDALILGRELTQNKTDNLEIAERLIKMGADVNFHDMFTHFKAPLHLTQSEAILRTLVAHGADINLQDDNGETPIAIYFYTEMKLIQAAIDLGADLRIRSNSGLTPLLNWAKNYHWGWAPAYDYALAHSAKIDINQGDAEGKTPLMLLSEVGWNRKQALVATIKKGADVNARDMNGKSVLEYWLKDSDPETIQILRDAGAQ